MVRALVFATLLLAACAPEAGRWSVHFTWEGGRPPDADLLWVHVRVEERDDPDRPGRGLATGVARIGVMTSVPIVGPAHGDNRAVVAEVRTGPDRAAQIRYFGVSQAFSVHPGEVVEVPVHLSLRSVPQLDLDVGLEIDGLTADDRVAGRRLRLELIGSAADRIVIAQDSSFEIAAVDIPAFEHRRTSTSAGGPVRYQLDYDLNARVCDETGCGDGPRDLYAKLVDSHGYPSATAHRRVVLDEISPKIRPDSIEVQLVPPSGSLTATVTALTGGAVARLSFDVSEPVGGLPVVTAISPVDSATASFAHVNGAATSFLYELTVTASMATGAHALTISVVDRAGLPASASGPTIPIDMTPPPAPSVDSPNLIVHTRTPWGDARTAAASASLFGGPAAVEPHATLLVLDAPDLAGAVEIVRGRADAMGGFGPLVIPGGDRQQVYVAAVDGAANASDVREVRDGVWTATLREAPDANPHRLATTPRTLDTLVQLGGGGLPADSIQIAAAAVRGGDTLEVAAAEIWTEMLQANGVDVGTALAFDAARGRTVSVDEGTWLFDGTGWRAADVPEGAGPPPSTAMVYDAARATVVLFAGSVGRDGLAETWAWDGAAWTLRHQFDGDGLAGRVDVAMAYDAGTARVVLFGGRDEGGLSGQTWLWDGASWRESASVGPAPRAGAAMGFDPDRGGTVLFGGEGEGGLLGDTWQWDGAGWTALQAGSAPPPRSGHAMAFDGTRNELVMVAGTGASGPLGDTWVLRNARWTQIDTGPLFVGDVDGVTFDRNLGCILARAADVSWQWDGAQWAVLVERVPGGRSAHGLAYDAGRDRLVLFGGGNSNGWLGDVWELEDERWARRTSGETGADPAARIYPGLAFDRLNDRTVLFGGVAGRVWPEGTSSWDGARWRTITAGGPAGRHGHAMAYDETLQRVLVFGGYGAAGLEGDTWILDGSRWRTHAGAGPAARIGAMMAYDRVRRRLVLFGGSTGATGLLGDTWLWDGATWAEVNIGSPAPAARALGAMAWDAASETLVLAGGIVAGARVNDVWDWDGSRWTERVVRGGPPPLTHHRMVFDEGRGRTVLFGGLDGTANLDATWRLAGDLWTPIATPRDTPVANTGVRLVYDDHRRAPLVSWTHLMWAWDGRHWRRLARLSISPGHLRRAVFDSRRSRIVAVDDPGGPTMATWEFDGLDWSLRDDGSGGPPGSGSAVLVYDGLNAVTVLPEARCEPPAITWLWDGAGWTQRPAPGTLPPRLYPSLAFDRTRQRTLLFGGRCSSYFADTWEWDGATWTERTPGTGSPPARHSAGFVHDDSQARTIMFGGYTGAEHLGDTWSWDGARWMELTPPTGSPPPRHAPGFVYDPVARQVLMFGGTGSQTYPGWLNDTWTFGRQPGQRPGALVTFDMTQLGHPPSSIRALSLTADAGGTSSSTSSATQVDETLSVLTTADAQAVLDVDRQRQLLGCEADAECVARVREATDAEAIVASTLGRVGRSLVLTMALVGADTTDPIARVSETFQSISELPSVVPRVVARLLSWAEAPVERTYMLPAGRSTSFAVLDLSATGVEGDVAKNLTQVVSSEIKRVEGTTVISRDDILAVLSADKLDQLLGIECDTSCVAEVGGALGVDQLVVGQVGKLSQTFVVSLRLIDPLRVVVSHRITESFRGVPDELLRAVRFASRRLIGVADNAAGSIAVSGPVPEAQVFVDGETLGALPMPPTRIDRTGRVSVRVSRDGYFDWQSDVYVNPGETTPVWAELEARPERWYEKWWLWTIVGGVVAGGSAAAVVLSQQAPADSIGDVSLQ